MTWYCSSLFSSGRPNIIASIKLSVLLGSLTSVDVDDVVDGEDEDEDVDVDVDVIDVIDVEAEAEAEAWWKTTECVMRKKTDKRRS